MTDTLPYGGDTDGTQLPINPDDYLATQYVQSMLAREGLPLPSESLCTTSDKNQEDAPMPDAGPMPEPGPMPEAPAEKVSHAGVLHDAFWTH